MNGKTCDLFKHDLVDFEVPGSVNREGHISKIRYTAAGVKFYDIKDGNDNIYLSIPRDKITKIFKRDLEPRDTYEGIEI